MVLLSVIMISACGQNKDVDIILEEVKNLKTVAQQKAYLEMIYEEDQGIRISSQDIEKVHGYNSSEAKSSWKKMQDIDDINIKRIEAYFKIHGYPSKELHGSDACFTPVIVIHHSPHGFAHRKEHFKTFYRAYIDGHHEAMDMYLTRMYYIKNDEHLNIDGPYTEEFEIDTLIRSMGLEKLRDEVMAGS